VLVWPDDDDFKAWARVADADTVDDSAISQALAAANVHIATRCTRLDPDGDDLPGDVFYACLLLTSRLLARRNSPEGLIGSADGVPTDIGSSDPDVWRLIGPYVEPGIA
jgi:hypothetical protein